MSWLLRRPAEAQPAPDDTTTMDGVTLSEIEAERAQLLRRRLLWCSSFFIALTLVSLAGDLADPELRVITVAEGHAGLRRFAELAISGSVEAGVMCAVSLGALAVALFTRPSVGRMLGTVTGLIVGVQAVSLARHVAICVFAPTHDALQILVQESALTLLLTFSVASLTIPWAPREAMRPLVPCFIMHQAALLALGSWTALAQAAGLVLIAAAAIPGMGYTLLRWRPEDDIAQLRVRSRRYSTLARDLFDARRIHESIFPAPIASGPVHLAYRYHPSQHIGGDFLYARRLQDDPTSPLFVLVVDVTGHGVGSALTVNRLHAEIERTLQERPETSPGEMLHRLNDYLHYTLAIHSVYATAVCLRVDAPDETGAATVRWASGGHPPILLRHADGSIERLWSTAFMLGVITAKDYESDERACLIVPGEVLLIYTDGAIDTPAPGGGMLEIEGVESLFLKALGDAETVAASLDRAIAGSRSERATDDTLLVVVTRPTAYRPAQTESESTGA